MTCLPFAGILAKRRHKLQLHAHSHVERQAHCSELSSVIEQQLSCQVNVELMVQQFRVQLLAQQLLHVA
jgi:hypothetical protein